MSGGPLIVELALAFLALPLLAASGYLFLLAVLARRPAPPPAPAPALRFDVVVPAHDEALGIAETVKSALAVDWPAALRRVVVVADNCTDATAAKAREAGAVVFERADAARRGKGHALDFAFRRIVEERTADAVVVIDADTVVTPNLLQAFSARLEAGAKAAQAHYGVRNPRASWRTRLLTIALALFHQVRSLARERLGVSCGLRGNGMCFTVGLLAQVPHDAFSVVEDVEYGIRLGRAGERVRFVWEAEVLGEMVSGEEASRSQRRRWEQGRAGLRRRFGWGLLREGLSKRSGLLVDLALDVLVPPLSRLAALAALGAGAAFSAAWWLGHRPAAAWLYVACCALLGWYVLTGWWVSGLGARGLLDLALAPFYVAWKVWLAVTKPGAKKGDWVRTTREGETRP